MRVIMDIREHHLSYKEFIIVKQSDILAVVED